MTFNIIVALSAFLISLLGTRLTILALRKRPRLLDMPNLRSNHVVPTPRGGGIAVVMALVIGLMIADVHFSIIIGLLLLAGVSMFDDWMGLSPIVRFTTQTAVVVLMIVAMDTTYFSGYLPPLLDKIVAALLWLWFINLFNFMDGIDGLAGSEMVSIGAGLTLLMVMIDRPDHLLFIYGIITASAGLGFLWWNWHPAKIFLGDVGSIPIGFFLGYLLLTAAASGYGVVALILPAYFMADATITLLRRLKQGKKPWQAHSEHYYQRAVRGGMRHDAVVRYVIGVNILLVTLAILAALNPEIAYVHVIMAYTVVAMVLGFFVELGRRREKV